MRPGRNAPDNEHIEFAQHAVDDASMRPGRNAPDNAAAKCAAMDAACALQ